MQNSSSPLPLPWRAIAYSIRGFVFVAAIALGAMIVITCLDVLLRVFKIPLTGANDIVRICSAIALAGALPATTAAKGHVTIEYFFHRLNRTGRRIVDVFVHGSLVACFLVALWQCVHAGTLFLASGQSTNTIQIPLFWVFWVMALGFLFSSFASLFHLLYPSNASMLWAKIRGGEK